jgi:hypothetical protein
MFPTETIAMDLWSRARNAHAHCAHMRDSAGDIRQSIACSEETILTSRELMERVDEKLRNGL